MSLCLAGCLPAPDSATTPNDGSETFVRPFEVDPEDYPFASRVFRTAFGRIHYFDEGPRDADETILMVHGNPTWSFLYRNIAKAMIEDGHRVIALDHLGMGMSDVPRRPLTSTTGQGRIRVTLKNSSSIWICRTSPWLFRTGAVRSAWAWRRGNPNASHVC